MSQMVVAQIIAIIAHVVTAAFLADAFIRQMDDQ